MEEKQGDSYFSFIDKETLNKVLSSGQFPFNKYLFWDTDTESLDMDKNSRFIIERVLTRGFLEDFYLITKIYSTEQIKKALEESKVLDPKTAHFCSNYFNVPLSKLHVSSFYS